MACAYHPCSRKQYTLQIKVNEKGLIYSRQKTHKGEGQNEQM